jgi:hypothetical protein
MNAITGMHAMPAQFLTNTCDVLCTMRSRMTDSVQRWQGVSSAAVWPGGELGDAVAKVFERAAQVFE